MKIYEKMCYCISEAKSGYSQMSRKEARVTAEDLSLRAGAPWPQAERGVGWERQKRQSAACNIRVTVLHVCQILHYFLMFWRLLQCNTHVTVLHHVTLLHECYTCVTCMFDTKCTPLHFRCM